MLKIGEAKEITQKQRLSWKEWSKKEGKFLLIAVFGPGRYPSWQISFDVGDATVKRTIDPQVGQAIIKKYKGFQGNLYIVVSKVNDVWELYLEEEQNDGWFYNLEGKNLIRRKADIPF